MAAARRAMRKGAQLQTRYPNSCAAAHQNKAEVRRMRRCLARVRQVRHENLIRVLGAVYCRGRAGGDADEASPAIGGPAAAAGGFDTTRPHLSILYELADAGSLAGLLKGLRGDEPDEVSGKRRTLGLAGSLRVLVQVASGISCEILTQKSCRLECIRRDSRCRSAHSSDTVSMI